MELSIRDNGLITNEADMADKYGLMDLFMRVSGTIIWQMEKADSSTLEAMFMKDNGLMIRLRARGFICIRMELHILVSG